MIRIIEYFFISLFVFLIEGCSLLLYYDQVTALKELGESQAEIKADVKNQEIHFGKLRHDIKNNHLKSGISKKYIVFRYGAAVFCKYDQGKVPIKQVCIYRLPGSNLDTGLIYLNFDSNEKLDSWEIVR